MSVKEIQKKLSILLGQAQLESGETFLDVLKELDNIWVTCKSELPKELVHFLSKRSYQKAYDYINELELS